MIIAVDYDRTLHDMDHPVPGRRMGPPMPGAKEAMEQLRRNGHTIIVHTARPADRHHVVREWMNYWQIPFSEITNIKPNADLFIDDKAVTYTSWPELMGGPLGSPVNRGIARFASGLQLDDE